MAVVAPNDRGEMTLEKGRSDESTIHIHVCARNYSNSHQSYRAFWFVCVGCHVCAFDNRRWFCTGNSKVGEDGGGREGEKCRVRLAVYLLIFPNS